MPSLSDYPGCFDAVEIEAARIGMGFNRWILRKWPEDSHQAVALALVEARGLPRQAKINNVSRRLRRLPLDMGYHRFADVWRHERDRRVRVPSWMTAALTA